MTAPSFFDQLRRLFASERVRETISVAAIFALAAYLLAPVLRGDWPVSHDHPVHLFRIWQLKQSLLHEHALWTWSNRWFAGYPQNELYPIGADLFVLAVQAISLGWLSLGSAYGLSILLCYFLLGYATCYFLRRATGSRLAALIAVFFLLTDAGWNNSGGWFWVIELGVWTAALGLIPALIATVRVADLLADPAPRRIVSAALWMAAAVLIHPLFLLYFAVAVPLLCASRYLATERTDWRRVLPKLGLSGGLSLLIASFWLIPYLAASPFFLEIKARDRIQDGNVAEHSWVDLPKTDSPIVQGDFFPRMHPVAVTAGLLGSLVLLRARRTLPLFMALFVFVSLALASGGLVVLGGPAAKGWIEKHIFYSRFLMLMKPFWLGAAGLFLVAAWKALGEFFPGASRADTPRAHLVRRVVLTAFVLVFALPATAMWVKNFAQSQLQQGVDWHSQRATNKAREELIAYARERWSQKFGFFRVAHGFEDDGHSLTDLGIDLPAPLFKVRMTPTGHFKYSIWSRDSAALRATNVRFAIAAHPLNGRDDLRLVRTFDQKLGLYEFKNWNPDPFEIEGEGSVKVLDFRNNEIALQADPDARGWLRLNVSYYPKWRATRDGVSIPISTTAPAGVQRAAFMRVELAPGRYRFHFQNGFTDYIGTVLAGIGLAGCALLAFPQLPGSRFVRKLGGS